MYSTVIAYLLWFLSGFGALGFHRFYLGKVSSGLLWMFSFGLFGFGAFYDFFTLPSQVREANIHNAIFNRRYTQSWRYAGDGRSRVVGHEKDSIERVILKTAKENAGILTVSEVALGANIPIEEAKKYLEALVGKGFAELRVRKSGTLVYVIPDMMDKDVPLEDF